MDKTIEELELVLDFFDDELSLLYNGFRDRLLEGNTEGMKSYSRKIHILENNIFSIEKQLAELTNNVMITNHDDEVYTKSDYDFIEWLYMKYEDKKSELKTRRRRNMMIKKYNEEHNKR